MTSNPFHALRRPVAPPPSPESAASPTTPARPRVTIASAQQGPLSGLPLFAGQGTSQWLSSAPTTVATDPAPQADSDVVDWGVVRRLVSDVADQLQTAMTQWQESHGGRDMPLAEQSAQQSALIRRVVAKHAGERAAAGTAVSAAHEHALVRAVHSSMTGLGRLQHLLDIEDFEDIFVVGNLPVRVRHADGRVEDLPPVAESSEDLQEQLHHIASQSQPRRAFDRDHVEMTINHQDRWRIHAISSEVSGMPSVTIRQHRFTTIALGDLADMGLAPEPVLEFLDQAVQAGKTIVISGDQGAGKTTLLRAAINAIPTHERFGTLETDQELFANRIPGREHTLTLFSRDGMGERLPDGTLSGALTVNELVPMALRQGLARLILGEVRGVEANAMFEAIRMGAGTMSTIHTPNVDQVPHRLAGMVALSGAVPIEQAYRQIADGVDLVVFTRRRNLPGRPSRRFIEAIHHYNGGVSETGMPARNEVYRANTWTGEVIAFDPPTNEGWTEELTQFRRPLPRLLGGGAR